MSQCGIMARLQRGKTMFTVPLSQENWQCNLGQVSLSLPDLIHRAAERRNQGEKESDRQPWAYIHILHLLLYQCNKSIVLQASGPQPQGCRVASRHWDTEPTKFQKGMRLCRHTHFPPCSAVGFSCPMHLSLLFS